ncbi:MAG: DUF362 domain-containing protein [Bryobacterales bacterium]|nr:DUF362 domain-containing protein [Bryobacterales bacterium]
MTSVATRRVYIDSLAKGYDAPLEEGFKFLSESVRITANCRVTIKPNLTFPEYAPGVMTSPEAVEAVVRYVRGFTNRITICESDSGGYNRFSMTEVFHTTGLDRIAAAHDAKLVNLSFEPSRNIAAHPGKREVSVPMPTLLLDETDLFITMPVPKIHMNTTVSVAIKNQWGTIQDPSDRLRLHPDFQEVVYAVNKIHTKSVAIVDGKYGLTRTGPLRGDVVNLNWLLMCDDIFYTDRIVSSLMGFDYREIPYLQYAMAMEGIHPSTPCEANTDWSKFQSDKFYLRREWTDYPGLVTFNSRAMAYIGYESALARPLHWLLYRFRQPFF